MAGNEIIVVDGGSTDNTVALAKTADATVLCSPKKGRAAQMNYGASMAKGDVLYFLHADSFPPKTVYADIENAINRGFQAGCYRLSFDYSHWLLKANCWFTRFNVDTIRFGDQSLFVTNALFKQLCGFDENHIVLEDQEFVKRIKKRARFTVLPKAVITSARKYKENGVYKTQAIFFFIYVLYRLGFSQASLVATYCRLLKQDKL